jgi:hypothetical protein
MMDNFAQILRRQPTSDASTLSEGTTPFKVQINFDIPIFEGDIDADVVDKWLNLLDPHVKDWWETFCEKKETEEPSLFIVALTWESFTDVIKEKYYHVGGYDYLYTKWTTLQQERDQAVPEFTNIFHTLHTKLGIKGYE